MFAVYPKLFLTAVIWGGTFISGRMLGPHVSPFSAAFLRFTVATIFLLAVAARAGGLPMLKGRDLPAVVLLGLTGVFAYNAFFFSGLQLIPAGRAALIIAANPVAIALFASVFFREPLGRQKILGIVLSVCGAITVISHGDPMAALSGGIGRGELRILGCVACWTAYSLIGRKAMQRLSPLTAVTWSCLIGALCLLPPALNEGLADRIADFPAVVWLNVLYLGLLGTGLGFSWYYQGIKAIGPSRASVFINFVPISAVLMACLILGESVDFSLGAGAVLVCCGIYLTNRPIARQSEPVEGPSAPA